MLSAVLAVAGSVTGFRGPGRRRPVLDPQRNLLPGINDAAPSCAEALTCPAGLALVWLLQPPGPYGWALGIWMFGLIQALYFVVSRH